MSEELTDTEEPEVFEYHAKLSADLPEETREAMFENGWQYKTIKEKGVVTAHVLATIGTDTSEHITRFLNVPGITIQKV